MQHWEIVGIFLLIAFVYASVGFGGGSSYLAILTLYGFQFQEMKFTALLCNIIVVMGSTIIFIRNLQMDWKKILPLVAASVPMAFIGALLKLNEDTFFIALGCSLIIAAALLWLKNRRLTNNEAIDHSPNKLRDGLIGGGIGFLSGMVGIGGGIFLAPILNLMKWDTPKKIAATASFFILVNSLSGIVGQISTLTDYVNFTRVGILCAAVFIGGQLGSRIGVVKFNQLVVRRVTAVVVFVAGVEVLIKHSHLF
ncbi:MAG: Sulfite exporter TauE/SafE [Flavipsychrobacter sp.]|jgi:uncharacterized membrane protein YfcA|nr:Sulfite exporter TauE/SafE [Flavipsychrobacter sp.]